MSEAYRASGVDVEAGYEAVRLMKAHVAKTFIPGALSNIGGFGGLFEIGKGYENPVLVSGTDGVGTKLMLAFIMDKHDTVGQDCVAMCANDVVCAGAKPLFFLDYLAVGRNVPEKIANIVKGVADGCVQAGAALVGGETAEMPGFYGENEYDLAGFCVGVVEKSKIVNKERVKKGDALIGVASGGLHSNGFSLVRKIFGIRMDTPKEKLSGFASALGVPLGEELLKPTKIYVRPLLAALERFDVHGIAHITGGGFYENIPRMLPAGVKAAVRKDAWERPPVFGLLQAEGGLSERDLFNTFNMGIGLVLAVPKAQAEAAVKSFAESGERAFLIGEVQRGNGEVELW
jgi:phosphoribosylformylglycinamidine cyclo-ligase